MTRSWIAVLGCSAGLLVACTDATSSAVAVSGSSGGTHGSSPTSSVPATPSLVSETTPALRAPRCAARQLTGREQTGGGVASQPFSIVTLTNISKQTCSLAGYPALVAWSSGYQGSTTSTGLHRLKITLTQGSLYEVPDPGPSSFSLAPAASAWFAVGTGTAWGPPVKVIPDLTVYLTPTTSSGVPVRVSLDADGPPGQPVPVKVTAFSAGTPPKA